MLQTPCEPMGPPRPATGNTLMPIYEYYCRTCNEKLTRMRPISASSENSECDSGHRAMKVITLPSAAMFGGDGARADADTAEQPVSTACACGRGACACGAF